MWVVEIVVVVEEARLRLLVGLEPWHGEAGAGQEAGQETGPGQEAGQERDDMTTW